VERELGRVRNELIRKTRLAAVGQVSASIAHDLRNPLASVRNAAFILSRRIGEDGPRMRENVGIIEQEVARADRIISNLLSLARAEPIHAECVDLGATVREVFAKTGKTEAVQCEFTADTEPFEVYADRYQLAQVISNILSNAIEAMEGKGTFQVEGRHRTEYDTIILSDTGPGIAPDVCPNIFEPLVTTKAKGIGLGLTICRQIVEAHRGKIELRQRIGKGVAFHITLPRKGHMMGELQEAS